LKDLDQKLSAFVDDFAGRPISAGLPKFASNNRREGTAEENSYGAGKPPLLWHVLGQRGGSYAQPSYSRPPVRAAPLKVTEAPRTEEVAAVHWMQPTPLLINNAATMSSLRLKPRTKGLTWRGPFAPDEYFSDRLQGE